MSDREKLLGIAVGSLLALFLVFGLYRMVNSGLASRKNEVNSLYQKHKNELAINKQRKRDQLMVKEFQKRALPGNLSLAQRDFYQWLETTVNDVGLSEGRVRSQGLPTTKKLQKELSYQVSARGDVTQLTELLHRFYSVDNLQRISSLNVQKQNEGQSLKIDLVVNALSMQADDPASQIPIGTVSNEKLPKSLAEYVSVINSRNLFSPANQAPEIKRPRIDDVEIGSRLSHKLEAEDPDGDEVEFSLGSGAPEWLKLTESGKLSGRPPKEEQEYEFLVVANDLGIPSKSSERTVKFEVVAKKEEAPAEKKEEEFDEASLAVLTAILRSPRQREPQMCMYLKAEDEVQYLSAGDRIKIGKWRGKVNEVIPSRNVAIIENDEGQYELRLGQALTDAKLMEEKVKAKLEPSDQELQAI